MLYDWLEKFKFVVLNKKIFEIIVEIQVICKQLIFDISNIIVVFYVFCNDINFIVLNDVKEYLFR